VTGRTLTIEPDWAIGTVPAPRATRAGVDHAAARGGEASARSWLPYNGVVTRHWDDPEFLRHVFEHTEILRKPLTGIITGYHVLPYIIVGPEEDRPNRSVEVRGRIKVSPRLVITPRDAGLTYGEFFAERELMDQAIVARVFSFRYAPRVNLEHEELKITRQEREAPRHLERVLDDLARQEIVNTGVISTPDVRFYPVSIDRFIREILDQEFTP
jgi:hypothetical protein